MIAPEQSTAILTDRQSRETALKQQMDEAIARLAQQLSDGHSAAFRELLIFYSRFWTYSVRNCLLIHQQRPTATRCAGLRLWNKLGYHVAAGEKAIWIWVPMVKKEPDPESAEEITVVTGFRPAPVFDFAQLKEAAEKPLPTFLAVLPDDVEQLYVTCGRKVEAAGIQLHHRVLPTGVLGVSQPGAITIATGLDSRNRLFALLHELTHELWHQRMPDPERTPAQMEFEAESVAFVAAAVMGLEHDSARDYLLTWRATPELLTRALLTIQTMVRQVLRLLEIPFDVPHTPEALVA